jgi:DNA polymerase III alpha subunit (gram-positive type)
MTPVYVVTDIEVDGPTPGVNSMLSFTSVAVNATGENIDEFEAVLAPLDGATSDPDTVAWFKTQPQAFAAATHDPQPAGDVIKRYVDWAHNLIGDPIFVSHPMSFDGAWMDHYLRNFVNIRLMKGPWTGE